MSGDFKQLADAIEAASKKILSRLDQIERRLKEVERLIRASN